MLVGNEHGSARQLLVGAMLRLSVRVRVFGVRVMRVVIAVVMMVCQHEERVVVWQRLAAGADGREGQQTSCQAKRHEQREQ